MLAAVQSHVEECAAGVSLPEMREEMFREIEYAMP